MEASQQTDALTLLEQRWQKRLDRERAARKEAERLLEEKSLALYERNVELRELASNLEKLVDQRTNELAVALKKAQAATLAKSEFLATMSHEIRTPLNGVLGMAQLLFDTELSEQQREYVSNLKNTSNTLLAIINDVLDFSKIEAGKLELESISYDLHQLINEVCAIFKLQAQQKGLSLQVEVDELVPRWIVGDPTRLRQILMNLLSNAMKFTESGTVGLAVMPSLESDVLTVCVWDTGVGMDEKARSKLFQAFSQADASTTRQYGGTGLGLAICDRLTTLMGGRIWVESEQHKGSRFYFTFVAPRGKETSQNTRVETSKSLAELKVLLVEDNAINRLVATKLLQKLNINAAIAVDGLEAVAMTEKAAYDLILMDMQMPNMDGLTATQHIRAMNLSKRPTIIALTANAMNEDQQRCLAAGMDDFISKPIHFDQLKQTLSRFYP